MKSETTKKRVKRIVQIAVVVLVAAIIGANVYYINASRLAGESMPMPLGVGMAVVLSGSMEKELSVGDLIVVVPQDSYNVDDVVVFREGRSTVTHRIIRIEDGMFITKGDANNTEDKPIAPDQIKGKVVLAIPFVGYVVRAIQSPVGTLCLVALAVFLLERSFRADKQHKDKQLDAIRAEIELLKQQQDEQQ